MGRGECGCGHFYWDRRNGGGSVAGGLAGGGSQAIPKAVAGLLVCANILKGVQDLAQDRVQPRERDDEDEWEFVGYHGTSSIYVTSILAKINPPSGKNYDGESQLGVGFYVTRSKRAAELFAEVAVDEAGTGSPVVLEVYAKGFSRMRGISISRRQWWNITSNSLLVRGFDYLELQSMVTRNLIKSSSILVFITGYKRGCHEFIKGISK
ncbi:MAG: hypothetical protein HGA19_14660 [Oscillochloris sp.]|nr:hypothetical protein [Oscillochloris sp.]